MATIFSRNAFGGFTGVALTLSLTIFLPTMPTARAASAEFRGPTCKPASVSIPIAALPRTAADMKAKAPIRILAIGSSSTQGIGATSVGNSYPSKLMTELNSMSTIVNVDVKNAGIGGETIDQTLARLVNELDTYKPDLVLWQVGTNDAITRGSDPELFQHMIDKGIKSILARHADAILIDQQYYPKIPSMPVYEQFIDAVHEVATENNVVVFPRFKLMETWNRELPGGVVTMLGPDQFHMGDRGYACLASLLADEITRSVARTDAVAVAASPALKASPASALAATKVGIIAAGRMETITPLKLVQP